MSQHLTAEAIQQALYGELPPEQETALHEHVETCPDCAAAFERGSGTDEIRRQIPVLLRDDELGDLVPGRDECSVTDFVVEHLDPADLPGALGRLGDYDVLEVIGRGGMGVVLKGYDQELKRFVAIKALAPHLASSALARKRFAREAQAAAAVVNLHVMAIHQVQPNGRLPFLVMPLLNGESLAQRLKAQGVLELREVLRIGLQAAEGLSAAHEQGLVHRDVKPANILLERGIDRAVITDFGLARTAADATLTRMGVIAGTPEYMSPEQAQGEAVDARSDLFSLGCVLYEMATGVSPFRTETPLATLRRIVDAAPRDVAALNPELPSWFAAIVSRLLAKDPAQRYQSAREIGDLLSGCLAHVQQPAGVALPSELRELDNSPRPAEKAQRTGERDEIRRGSSWFQRRWTCLSRNLVACAALVGVVTLIGWRLMPLGEDLTALQGEWQLIILEREGRTLPESEHFNERLIVDNSNFARFQTAPNGMELKGESGRLSVARGKSGLTVDWKMMRGTAQGLYKLAGDELVVCTTRDGGPRPDSFQTAPGDARVLQVYRRKRNVERRELPAPEFSDTARYDTGSRRKWTEAWITKVTAEVTGSMELPGAQQWLLSQGFQKITSGIVTVEVMKRIHPGATEQSLQRDGVRFYLYGFLPSPQAEHGGAAIEVYFLFGDRNQLLATAAGPAEVGAAEQADGEKRELGAEFERARPARGLTLKTRPVMAENASVIACLGPERPVRLGSLVECADIGRDLDPSLVFLHVWDWSISDMSRVLLLQRSELGTLSPDGRLMLTQEGELIDLHDKQTRQYSGFEVPRGQRVTALQFTSSRRFAAAIIHTRTDVEQLATDPPTTDARHFWNLRLLQLDAATHRGQRVGEYPVNARPGIMFAADESSVVYSTDQHAIVRRDASSGKLLQSYEPTLGVQGAVGLALSPDGKWVAAASYLGTLFVWDANSGALRFQLEATREDGEPDQFFKADVLRFSRDGSKLAAVAGNRVKVVDVGTGKIVREQQDPTHPRFVHAQWSHDGSVITLVTSSQSVPLPADRANGGDADVEREGGERLPRVYAWNWQLDGAEARPLPERDQQPAQEAPAARIDPDLEARRFSGSWRVVARTTDGVEQRSEVGQIIRIRRRRMDEVRLDLDPNQTPRTIDVVFVKGPDRGKVLRGIYEWIPRASSDARNATGATGEALRICTFTEPRADQARPANFEAGKEVDTAIWERLDQDSPDFAPIQPPRVESPNENRPAAGKDADAKRP